MAENNRLFEQHPARIPGFMSAAPRLQIETARFGSQEAALAGEKPLLSVVDGHRQIPAYPARPATQKIPSAPVASPTQAQAPAAAAAAAQVEPSRISESVPTPELLARIADGVDGLRSQGEKLAAMARSDALELGFLVAQKILEMELKASPAPLFSLIRSALRRAGEDRVVSLKLHPADLALVQAQAHESTGLTVAQVKLTADPGLERGDCVVETDFGTVDGRLSSRLAELRRAFSFSQEEEGGS